jgi:hypothetical protein
MPLASADASDVLQGADCIVEAGTTVEGNIYALCRTLVINGTVEGDVFAAAVSANVTGRVNGSLYVAGGRLRLSGEVTGKVHFGGVILHILPEARLGDVASSIYSAAVSTHLEAPLPGNIGAIGYQLVIDAPVGRQIDFSGSALRVNSTVGGSITASVGDRQNTGVQELQWLIQLVDPNVTLQPPGLVVTADAVVSGTITYAAPSPGLIDGQTGDVIFNPIVPDGDLTADQDFGMAVRTYFELAIREFVTLFLIGAVVLTIAPRFVQSPIGLARRHTLTSISAGLLAFILSFPVLLLAVMISLLIVLLVSLIGYDSITLLTVVIALAVNLAGIVLFYFVALFISRVIISLAIGRVLLRPVYQSRNRMIDAYAQLAAGALALALLTALPYVGAFVTALSALLGFGAMITALQQPSRRTVEAAIQRPVPEQTLPPPPRDGPPPGMSNLPDGFDWWK